MGLSDHINTRFPVFLVKSKCPTSKSVLSTKEYRINIVFFNIFQFCTLFESMPYELPNVELSFDSFLVALSLTSNNQARGTHSIYLKYVFLILTDKHNFLYVPVAMVNNLVQNCLLIWFYIIWINDNIVHQFQHSICLSADIIILNKHF